MRVLTKRLEKIKQQRETGRQQRAEIPVPSIALVGYTNAGKSTLFRALTDEPAIRLELCLAGTAHADTALLALEVGPPPHQAAGDVLQLRKLHFELAFEAAGALREDVEDETVAIEHAAARKLLEVALLAWGQCVVDEDDVGFVGLGNGADLVRFAASHEVPWVWTLAPTCHGGDRARTGRFRELREFLQIFRFDLGT